MKHISKTAATVCTLVLSLTMATVPCIAATQAHNSQRPILKNPVSFSTQGTVTLDDEKLMDLIIPATINGVTVEAIGAYAFENCALIRTATIPATVTSIGEGAFASCPYLESIVLEDRSDLADLQVGANWAGNAQIYFASAVEEQSPLDGFQKLLKEVQVIKTVDATNLENTVIILQTLDDAYAALSEPDQAYTGTVYQKTRHTLLCLIQQAEASENVDPASIKPEEETSPASEETDPTEPVTELPPDTSSDPVPENITGDAHTMLP